MAVQLEYEINKELGECYLFMGDLEKAEGYYQKALAENTGHSTPYLALAAIAIQKKDLSDAENYYRKAIELEVSDKAMAGLGLVYMELEQDENAYNCFNQALALNPCNSVALNCIVRQGYKLEKLSEIVYILSKSLDIQENEDVRVSLAGCLVSLGRIADAKECLNQVLSGSPHNETAKELMDHLAA